MAGPTRHTHRNYKCYFYTNKLNGESQWDYPDGEVEGYEDEDTEEEGVEDDASGGQGRELDGDDRKDDDNNDGGGGGENDDAEKDDDDNDPSKELTNAASGERQRQSTLAANQEHSNDSHREDSIKDDLDDDFGGGDMVLEKDYHGGDEGENDGVVGDHVNDDDAEDIREFDDGRDDERVGNNLKYGNVASNGTTHQRQKSIYKKHQGMIPQ